MSKLVGIKTRSVQYARGSIEKSLVCRGCTQETRRAILCKPETSPQWIITPWCDQCFESIKQLPAREHNIKIVRPS